MGGDVEMTSIRKVTASDAVYEQLRDDIISLFFQPGEKLSETRLAERYGVSRDPVRKSISRLVQEGMLESRPQVGTIVKAISIEKGNDVCELRKILEVYAITRAIDSIPLSDIDEMLRKYDRIVLHHEQGEDVKNDIYALDEQMHRSIYDHCRNSMLASTIDSFSPIIKRIQISNMTYHQRMESTLSEMHDILLAIRDRDEKRAVEAMTTHIENIRLTLAK